jgi:hypothetical protein
MRSRSSWKLFRNRFGGNMREVFFQTNNCTGAAFLADSEQPLPFVTVVSGNAYVGNTTAAIASTFIGSTLHDDGSCTLGPGGLSDLLPAIRVDLSIYVPPFGVR